VEKWPLKRREWHLSRYKIIIRTMRVFTKLHLLALYMTVQQYNEGDVVDFVDFVPDTSQINTDCNIEKNS